MSIFDERIKVKDRRAEAPGTMQVLGGEPLHRRCLNCRNMTTAPSGDRYVCSATGKNTYPANEACEHYERWKPKHWQV